MPRRWSGHVKRIAGKAVTDKFAMDSCAPFERVRQGLEDDNSGTLADDETVAVNVEWATCFFGFLVASGDRPHRIEAGHAHRGDRRFRSAGDHDVGVTVGDETGRIPDRAGAGGACGDGAIDRPFCPESNGNMAGGEVGQDGGNREGGHLPRTALQDGDFFPFDGGQSADARADDDAGPFRSFLSDGQTRIGHGHLGGGQRIDNEIVEATKLFLVDVTEGIESLDFGGDFRLKRRAVETGDGRSA